MLNQIVLVGRISKDIESFENFAIMTLNVPRSYKNADGEFDIDSLPCVLWKGISSSVIEYCHAGDLVGIKGRLENKDNNIRVVAEKVTFLSNKKVEEGDL